MIPPNSGESANHARVCYQPKQFSIAADSHDDPSHPTGAFFQRDTDSRNLIRRMILHVRSCLPTRVFTRQGKCEMTRERNERTYVSCVRKESSASQQQRQQESTVKMQLWRKLTLKPSSNTSLFVDVQMSTVERPKTGASAAPSRGIHRAMRSGRGRPTDICCKLSEGIRLHEVEVNDLL